MQIILEWQSKKLWIWENVKTVEVYIKFWINAFIILKDKLGEK